MKMPEHFLGMLAMLYDLRHRCNVVVSNSNLRAKDKNQELPDWEKLKRFIPWYENKKKFINNIKNYYFTNTLGENSECYSSALTHDGKILMFGGADRYYKKVKCTKKIISMVRQWPVVVFNDDHGCLYFVYQNLLNSVQKIEINYSTEKVLSTGFQWQVLLLSPQGNLFWLDLNEVNQYGFKKGIKICRPNLRPKIIAFLLCLKYKKIKLPKGLLFDLIRRSTPIPRIAWR